MFRIGEFAQIAQVSGRLLRYYDELGLLAPAHIDRETGYRYYSVRQLPRLNAILALKELGLTLDEIGPMLARDLPPDELRGMLTLKRVELARSIAAEEARLRHIDSRIDQIDRQGALEGYDVVVKAVPAQPFLALRDRFADFDHAIAVVAAIADAAARQIRAPLRDRLVVIGHSVAEDDGLDLEIGVSLTAAVNRRVTLPDGRALALTELPAAPRMATVVRTGPPYESHQAFSVIGEWMEAQGCAVDGPAREVFLEPLTGAAALPAAHVEIQFPVRDAA